MKRISADSTVDGIVSCAPVDAPKKGCNFYRMAQQLQQTKAQSTDKKAKASIFSFGSIFGNKISKNERPNTSQMMENVAKSMRSADHHNRRASTHRRDMKHQIEEILVT